MSKSKYSLFQLNMQNLSLQHCTQPYNLSKIILDTVTKQKTDYIFNKCKRLVSFIGYFIDKNVDLEKIKDLTNLEQLILYGAKGNEFLFLNQLFNLKRLELNRTSLNDKHIENFLPGLNKQIQYLSLIHNHITVKSLKLITQTLPNIKQLYLDFNIVNKCGLQIIITQCKQLTHLSVNGAIRQKQAITVIFNNKHKLECLSYKNNFILQYDILAVAKSTYLKNFQVSPLYANKVNYNIRLKMCKKLDNWKTESNIIEKQSTNFYFSKVVRKLSKVQRNIFILSSTLSQ